MIRIFFLCVGIVILMGYQNNESFDIHTCFTTTQNCTEVLINFFENNPEATCYFYDISHPDILAAITNQTIYVDAHLDIFTPIKTKGLMHHKLCYTQDTILTGSTNPTMNGLTKNNNNVVIIQNKKLAHAVKTNQSIITLNISWHNCIGQCIHLIEQELRKAKQEVRFMIFTFTHKSIATALIDLHQKNISVQGLIEKRSASHEIHDLLAYQGINVSFDSNPNLLHHKVFIIDKHTVITGSFNPTKNANSKNWENILIIRNKTIAEKYLKEFTNIEQGIIPFSSI